MRTFRALFAFIMWFPIASAAHAQTNAWTPVTATQLSIGNTPLTGTIYIAPVNGYGQPLSITTVDGRFVSGALSASVTSGAIANGFSVPDQCTATATTPNSPVSYQVQIVGTSPKGTVTFTIPATAPAACGSGGFALDHYSAAQTVVASAVGIVVQPIVPARCTVPSIYYPNSGSSPVTRVCIGGVFVQTSGSSSGSGLTWAGAWSGSTGYTTGTAVLRNGSSYVALQASTNQDPATATSYWQLIAQKGDTGAAGAAGATGATGQTGATGAAGADATLGSYAFASFPTTGLTANKTMVIQTDAAVGSSCTAGGGAVRRLCLYNGTAWVPADDFAAEKGVANGIASLDGSVHIPSAQMPAATNAARGTVQLASGQTSSTLSKVATTGAYADLSGTPAPPIQASGLMALYQFTETSGAALKDYSGQGNDGTLTGSPTRDGYGYTFTSSAGQYVDVPSSLNSALTIHELINFPLTITGSYNNNSTLPILGNSNAAGAAGFELWAFGTNSSAGNYSLTAFTTATGQQISTTDSYWAGPHVLTVTCPPAAKPLLYLDGFPINNTYASTVVSCNGLQTAGNYRFGTTARNNNGPITYTYYGAAFYSVVQDAATVAATANALRAIAVARGVQVAPLSIITPSPNYFASGDSITCGFPQAGCVAGASSPVGYPYVATTQTNKTYIPVPYGVPGNVVTQAVITEPYRAWTQCRAIGGGSINSLFMSTNDFTAQNVSGAVVSDRQASFAKGATAAGCRPFLIGMLSRSGNAAGAVSWDQRKNEKNAEDRAEWQNWQYLAYVDFGTDPLLGADGAFQGTVSFTGNVTSGSNSITSATSVTTQNVGGVITGTGIPASTTITAVSGSTVTISANATASGTGVALTSVGNTYTYDGTHPSATTGYNRIGAAVACAINSLDGSSPGQMNQVRVTATATATCADGGRLLDATAGSITYTLPTAMYQTGRKVRYCNVTPTGSNTVTLAAPSDFPFNNVSGTTTLAITQGACVNLEGTWNGITTTATGAYWRSF